MNFVKFLLISFTGIIFCAGPLQAQINESSEMEITTVPVSEKIYVLQGPEGNTALSIGSDGILIADDQFLSEGIQRAIKKIKDAPFKIRINTDGAGSQLLNNAQGAVILHDGINEVLTQEQAADFFTHKETPSKNITTVTLGENTSLRFNDEEIRVMVFLNQNSLEDNMVYFVQSKIVFMGDNYFSGMFPAIDPNLGGDVEKYTDNVSVVLDYLPDEIKIIPGRGPVSTKDDLADFKRMLIETIATVRSKMKEEKDLQTIQQEGLGEQWLSWGKGIVSTDQWIEIIYNSLQHRKV